MVPRPPWSKPSWGCESCGREGARFTSALGLHLCDICVESGVEQLIRHLSDKFESGEIRVGLLGRFKFKPIVVSAHRRWKRKREASLKAMAADTKAHKMIDYLKRLING